MSDISINKHGGNQQSNIANLKANKIVDRRIILEYIKENGTGYSKQLSRFMNKGMNRISGRFSELKANNLIEDTGLTEEGCTVYRLKRKEPEVAVIEMYPNGETNV